MSFHAQVLWTRHLTKKRKTRHDGSLTVEPCGHASLQDDSNSLLATAKLAPNATFPADAEGAAREQVLQTVFLTAQAPELPWRRHRLL